MGFLKDLRAAPTVACVSPSRCGIRERHSYGRTLPRAILFSLFKSQHELHSGVDQFLSFWRVAASMLQARPWRPVRIGLIQMSPFL